MSEEVKQGLEPVVDLVIRLDSRTGEVTGQVIGAENVPVEVVYEMMDAYRRLLQQQQSRLIQELMAKTQPEEVRS